MRSIAIAALLLVTACGSVANRPAPRTSSDEVSTLRRQIDELRAMNRQLMAEQMARSEAEETESAQPTKVSEPPTVEPQPEPVEPAKVAQVAETRPEQAPEPAKVAPRRPMPVPVPMVSPLDEPFDTAPPQHHGRLYAPHPVSGCADGPLSVAINNHLGGRDRHSTQYFVRVIVDGAAIDSTAGSSTVTHVVPPHQRTNLCLWDTGVHNVSGTVYIRRGDFVQTYACFSRDTPFYNATLHTWGRQSVDITEEHLRNYGTACPDPNERIHISQLVAQY